MVDSEDDSLVSSNEVLLALHRQEKKSLQAQIHQLKKNISGDKKKKKETKERIEMLEVELKEKHKKELDALDEEKMKFKTLSNGVESLVIKDGNENSQNYQDPKEVPTNIIYKERQISKAEKKKQKKAMESKLREERIKEEDEKNKFSARNVEVEKLKQILKERQLAMHEIRPDGNCLYAAIAHQLDDSSVDDLRKAAGLFMRTHADEFSPFITDPQTGDLLSMEQFYNYCHQLETSPMWGGQPELRALSQAKGLIIEVLQAEGAPIIFGEEFGSKQSILLAYYRHYFGLGEHYNSVVPLKIKL